MAPLVLGYWDIRGLAQPIRYLLEYTGQDYEDFHYITVYNPPLMDKSMWFDVKHTLGLPFANLPYCIDGDVKLTQSGAILRYVARKADPGLLGKTMEEQNAVDLIECQINDFRSAFVSMCYNPDFANLKSKYLETLPDKLAQFEQFLGNKKFFAGDSVTIVDFIVFEMMDQQKVLEPTCLDKFPALQAFVSRVEQLPRLSDYLKSDKFKDLKNRLNNRQAKFGSGTEIKA